MRRNLIAAAVTAAALAMVPRPSAAGAVFSFSTGDPDGRMATASRPESAGKFEIEAADDFLLPTPVSLRSATFTGLLPTDVSLSAIQNVVVEIYRVFPKDSNVGRTSGAPDFSTPNVPTRVNSPSDVAFDSRDSAGGGLSFTPGVISSTFTADNSVQPGGIHPKPGQTTGGDNAVTGQEVVFNIKFTHPVSLPRDHFFFVPQVELSGSNDFLWLSAPRPIFPPGTPFMPDLQSWTRDASLDPDWLRVGTDIVGGLPAPTFNAAFSLTGTVPEPAGIALLGFGLACLLAGRAFTKAG